VRIIVPSEKMHNAQLTISLNDVPVFRILYYKKQWASGISKCTATSAGKIT